MVFKQGDNQLQFVSTSILLTTHPAEVSSTVVKAGRHYVQTEQTCLSSSVSGSLKQETLRLKLTAAGVTAEADSQACTSVFTCLCFTFISLSSVNIVKQKSRQRHTSKSVGGGRGLHLFPTTDSKYSCSLLFSECKLFYSELRLVMCS